MKNKTFKNKETKGKEIKNKKKKSKEVGKGKTKVNIQKIKKINFIKERCSPKNDNETLEFSCYTTEALNRLKEIWNKRHPDSMITSKEPKQIWNALRYSMNNSCNKESCWLKHKCIKEDIDNSILENNFAPTMPEEWKKNPNEWLSSVDILKVMKQWENKQ